MRIRSLGLALAFLTASIVSRAQLTVLPLWPNALPQPAQTTEPEKDVSKPTDVISGHHTSLLTNVTRPTLAVYAPSPAKNTHAAALVFPGGGYFLLAWDGEGLDTCAWLNRLGMTCILVKYRVPEKGRFPANAADLEDAQQAMRITRSHAMEWHLNPHRIGVIGFSAGGNLAALLSLYPGDRTIESTPAKADADTTVSAAPNFVILGYPAYLALDPDQSALDPAYTPNATTPRTFLVAAEDDAGYGRNALVYYRALLDAKRPAELHMFPTGGHGFGMFPNSGPVHWTALAEEWLHTSHILPPPPPNEPSIGGAATGDIPCPMPQPPNPGKPNPTQPQNNPACP